MLNNIHDIEKYKKIYSENGNVEKLKYLIEVSNYIGRNVYVKIDRPLGSKPIKEHPDFVYELNYGFVPNTISGDGEELDCYVLGVDIPLAEFNGKCIAIVHRLNEIDDKLIIVPEGVEYSIEEIETMICFSEKHHRSIVLKYK